MRTEIYPSPYLDRDGIVTTDNFTIQVIRPYIGANTKDPSKITVIDERVCFEVIHKEGSFIPIILKLSDNETRKLVCALVTALAHKVKDEKGEYNEQFVEEVKQAE